MLLSSYQPDSRPEMLTSNSKESIIKDITPAGDLLVPSSLSTKVRFNAQMSVEDIISTMYHLVYNPHDLLPCRQDDLVARISHAIFTPAHVSDYHILRHKLRALERTFYGVVRLSSVCIESALNP